MTRWGKAGVRLDPRERAARRADVAARRSATERADADAHRRWQAGEVVPDRITLALDAKGLEGPEVDAACGTAEPDVDRWESGDLYPSWEQLRALAALTGVTPAFFMADADPRIADGGSLRFHLRGYRPRVPVREFSPAALAWAAAEHGVQA